MADMATRQASTEAAGITSASAFAKATDEHGALILARAPPATDNVCSSAPAVLTNVPAAAAFAARLDQAQRANVNAPNGCYLDC